MDRRDAMKLTVMYLGFTLSSGTIASILSGCRADDSIDWLPKFFSSEEVNFLDALAETILPKTHTPGAKDAMVTRFIDTVRPLRFSEDDNNVFKQDLGLFIRQAKEENKQEFIRLSSEKRHDWVMAVDAASYKLLETDTEPQSEARPFYLALKEMILAGYFSSEIVAKHYFEYDPVPGRYDPCISYEDIGRAWALG